MIRILWLCLLLGGCGNYYVKLDEASKKTVNIPQGYTVLYCVCMDNELQREVVSRMKGKGVLLRELANLDQIKQLNPSRYIVLFSMKREVRGNPRRYKTTSLEQRSERKSCGKNCSVSRSWNELALKSVSSSGNSSHSNVLLYRVDEDTELMLALNSGQRYSIRIASDAVSGSAKNIIQENREYEIHP